MDDGVPDLMARPDVDQVGFCAVKVKLVACVEQGRRQHKLDAVKVVVLQQLQSRSHKAGVDSLDSWRVGR